MENVILNNSLPFDNSKRIMAIAAILLTIFGLFFPIFVLVAFVLASAAMVLMGKDSVMLKSYGENYSNVANSKHSTSKMFVIIAFVLAVIAFIFVMYSHNVYGTSSIKEIIMQKNAKVINRI